MTTNQAKYIFFTDLSLDIHGMSKTFERNFFTKFQIVYNLKLNVSAFFGLNYDNILKMITTESNKHRWRHVFDIKEWNLWNTEIVQTSEEYHEIEYKCNYKYKVKIKWNVPKTNLKKQFGLIYLKVNEQCTSADYFWRLKLLRERIQNYYSNSDDFFKIYFKWYHVGDYQFFIISVSETIRDDVLVDFRGTINTGNEMIEMQSLRKEKNVEENDNLIGMNAIANNGKKNTEREGNGVNTEVGISKRTNISPVKTSKSLIVNNKESQPLHLQINPSDDSSNIILKHNSLYNSSSSPIRQVQNVKNSVTFHMKVISIAHGIINSIWILCILSSLVAPYIIVSNYTSLKSLSYIFLSSIYIKGQVFFTSLSFLSLNELYGTENKTERYFWKNSWYMLRKYNYKFNKYLNNISTNNKWSSLFTVYKSVQIPFEYLSNNYSFTQYSSPLVEEIHFFWYKIQIYFSTFSYSHMKSLDRYMYSKEMITTIPIEERVELNIIDKTIYYIMNNILQTIRYHFDKGNWICQAWWKGINSDIFRTILIWDITYLLFIFISWFAFILLIRRVKQWSCIYLSWFYQENSKEKLFMERSKAFNNLLSNLNEETTQSVVKYITNQRILYDSKFGTLVDSWKDSQEIKVNHYHPVITTPKWFHMLYIWNIIWFIMINWISGVEIIIICISKNIIHQTIWYSFWFLQRITRWPELFLFMRISVWLDDISFIKNVNWNNSSFVYPSTEFQVFNDSDFVSIYSNNIKGGELLDDFMNDNALKEEWTEWWDLELLLRTDSLAFCTKSAFISVEETKYAKKHNLIITEHMQTNSISSNNTEHDSHNNTSLVGIFTDFSAFFISCTQHNSGFNRNNFKWIYNAILSRLLHLYSDYAKSNQDFERKEWFWNNKEWWKDEENVKIYFKNYLLFYLNKGIMFSEMVIDEASGYVIIIWIIRWIVWIASIVSCLFVHKKIKDKLKWLRYTLKLKSRALS